MIFQEFSGVCIDICIDKSCMFSDHIVKYGFIAVSDKSSIR
jgi:hypothetical protein